MNDRNDRAIRVVVKWYNAHLASDESNVKVVLLTDDMENKTRATKDNILAMSSKYDGRVSITRSSIKLTYIFLSVKDYVASLKKATSLLDKLCKRSYIVDTQSRELFPCHLTPAEVHDGISSGKLLQGTFLSSRENFLEGNVNVDGREKPVRCKQNISQFSSFGLS